jgi:enolase
LPAPDRSRLQAAGRGAYAPLDANRAAGAVHGRGGRRDRDRQGEGTSTGSREALELRDGDKKRFGGKGVAKAVANVNDVIAPAIDGLEALDQGAVDAKLLELDGTANKDKLGANAILGVSMAVARAAADSRGLPLYRYLGGVDARILPVLDAERAQRRRPCGQQRRLPGVRDRAGGRASFKEAMRWAAECYQALKSTLKTKGLGTGVGDEGGFAPNLKANVDAVEVILAAIQKAGLSPGKDVVIALDPAASEFFEDGKYVLAKSDKSKKSSEEMVAFWVDWAR